MSKDLKTRIFELRAKKYSFRQISIKLHVSTATVKYHLRQNKDKQVSEFAKKLQTMVAAAPAGICRNELNSAIDRIRKGSQARYIPIYPLILKLIDDGCETKSDFQFETDFSDWTLREILDEMIRFGEIEVRFNPPEPNRYFRKL